MTGTVPLVHMVNGHQFYIRDGNFGDLYTVKENLEHRQYKTLNLKPEDVVLDLGGHIGTFAVSVAPSVRKVVSVEMDADNFRLLTLNTEPYDNITIVNVACVSQEDSCDDVFYWPGNKNSGATSMYVKRGRRGPFVAKAARITDILQEHTPTVIKCDVEGAEYNIFRGLTIPQSVRQIIMELHFGHREWRDEANSLQKHLIDQGFETEFVDCTQNRYWTLVKHFNRKASS